MLSSSPSGWPLEDSTSHETKDGWPLEDSTSHEQRNHMDRYAYTCYSPPLYFPFLSPSTTSPQAELAPDPPSTPFGAANGESKMVRKLNHKTSKCDRRKKTNGVYSTLHSLLPAANQTKKLSIPTTVSQARKYISEVQQQVEKLAREKEKLLSRMNATRDGDYRAASRQEINEGKGSLQNLVPSISAARLSESEVTIQICTRKVMAHQTVDFSDVLHTLDYHGFPLISSSTFESCGGTRTTFYNLHVQVERSRGMEGEALKEKLSALFDHRKRSDVDFLRPTREPDNVEIVSPFL